jgi:hypothetical protein
LRRADNLITFMCRFSKNSGNLNFLEPLGPRVYKLLQGLHCADFQCLEVTARTHVIICRSRTLIFKSCCNVPVIKKSKAIPRQAEVALGVPGRLIPRIFSTFGTSSALRTGRLYSRRNPWYSFSEAEWHVVLSE